MKKYRITLMIALSLVYASCTSVPDIGRQQFNILSPQQEAQLGFDQFSQYKRTKTISKNAHYNQQLQNVAKRLTKVITLPHAQWEFVVFEDKSPNAFALPGGKVGVHTSIFQITQNEAGLATVVGHEIAHVVARHSGERASHGLVTAGLGIALDQYLKNEGKSEEDRQKTLGAYGTGTTVGHLLPFSRKQEIEADQLGTLYMARAGYAPHETVAFWKRFQQYKEKSGKHPPEFLSTHPLDSTRIRKLEEFMPRALAEYRLHNQNRENFLKARPFVQ